MVDNVTKVELIDRVSKKIDKTKKDSEELTLAVFDVVKEILSENKRLSIVGFGTFEVAERAERQARNPQTGSAITVPACKVPKFKPAKALKELINA